MAEFENTGVSASGLGLEMSVQKLNFSEPHFFKDPQH